MWKNLFFLLFIIFMKLNKFAFKVHLLKPINFFYVDLLIFYFFILLNPSESGR